MYLVRFALTANRILPQMEEGSIVWDYNTPRGTSLEETERILREAEKIIVKIPDIEAYYRRTGIQRGFFITEPQGDNLIQLKKNRNRSTEDVINELRQKIQASTPFLTIDFG